MSFQLFFRFLIGQHPCAQRWYRPLLVWHGLTADSLCGCVWTSLFNKKKIIGVFEVFYFLTSGQEKKAFFKMSTCVWTRPRRRRSVSVSAFFRDILHLFVVMMTSLLLSLFLSDGALGTVTDVQSRAKLHSPPSITLKDLISAQHHWWKTPAQTWDQPLLCSFIKVPLWLFSS